MSAHSDQTFLIYHHYNLHFITTKRFIEMALFVFDGRSNNAASSLFKTPSTHLQFVFDGLYHMIDCCMFIKSILVTSFPSKHIPHPFSFISVHNCTYCCRRLHLATRATPCAPDVLIIASCVLTKTKLLSRYQLLQRCHRMILAARPEQY